VTLPFVLWLVNPRLFWFSHCHSTARAALQITHAWSCWTTTQHSKQAAQQALQLSAYPQTASLSLYASHPPPKHARLLHLTGRCIPPTILMRLLPCSAPVAV
jgi:hypothetical protein